MSCYLCSHETFANVLKAWCDCIDIDIHDNASLMDAWHDIIDANFQAYQDRYGDDDIAELYERFKERLPFTYKAWFYGVGGRLSNVDRYDCLKEYIYQCTEGDYYLRLGYYKSRWCLDRMLEDFIEKECNNE